LEKKLKSWLANHLKANEFLNMEAKKYRKTKFDPSTKSGKEESLLKPIALSKS